MSSTLGQKLRAAREQRGISISEVAEQTRISPLYLEAIDADSYKTLPGGIFNKGFIKSYAKYVGVDEQEALKDYSRQIAAEEPEEDKLKTYRPEVLTDDRAASSMLPTILFAAVILGLMTAGVLFLVNYIQNRQEEPQVVSNSGGPTANTNSSANANPAQPAPASQAPAMNSLKVEFLAVGDAVSLTSVVDNAKGTEKLLAPGSSELFEPKESLKLRYSRSRAEFAQLKLNGKQITLPSQPANPKAATIEIEINGSNLAQVWETGSYSVGSPAAAEASTSTTAPVSAPSSPRPATPRAVNSVANTAANTSTSNTERPPAPPTMTGRPPARATQTPVVVGRPTNSQQPN